MKTQKSALTEKGESTFFIPESGERLYCSMVDFQLFLHFRKNSLPKNENLLILGSEYSIIPLRGVFA